MNFLKRFLAMSTLVALAACGGGGGDAGTSVFEPDTGNPAPPATPVADVVVVLAAETIFNSSDQGVRVTATALDASRRAIPDAPMTLAADAGAVVTVDGNATVTDDNGQLGAVVSIGSDRTNRVITVTATSGSISKTTTLTVVSSPAAATPASIELIASSTTVDTGGAQVVIQAFVKDLSNNALAGADVSFSVDTGTLTNVSATTAASGVATANFSAGSDKSNRTATVTVTSGTVQSQLTLPISGTKVTVAGPSSLILGAAANFTVQVADSNNNPLPGVSVSAVSELGNTLSAASGTTTDANGAVTFNYVASNVGPDEVIFIAAGATSPPVFVSVSGDDFQFVSPAPGALVPVGSGQDVQVRLRQGGVAIANRAILFTATGGTLSAPSATTDAQGLATVSLSATAAGPVTVQARVEESAATAALQLNIVATVPHKLVLQVSDAAIAPNPTGSTDSQTRVIAKVTDPVGNPVQGLTVNFSRDADPSGGNLLQPSAVTDLNGQASVAYSAGPESTANNGVVLRGTVASTTPPVTDTATLTVNQTALFITLGTGNAIANVDPETYQKDWVVYVTDSNGVAVSGVSLSIKILPLEYLAGSLVPDPWVYSPPIRTCRNEDSNENGVLDPGEDDNGDGVLWPGNVISVSPGSVQTDATGRATISLIYAESFAPWVKVRLTASATVSGTESKRDAEFIVNGSVEDFNLPSVPAGATSPFGTYDETPSVPGCR